MTVFIIFWVIPAAAYSILFVVFKFNTAITFIPWNIFIYHRVVTDAHIFQSTYSASYAFNPEGVVHTISSSRSLILFAFSGFSEIILMQFAIRWQ